MIIFKKQSGFAPLIAVLMVLILIVAGGTGYYLYKHKPLLKEKEVIPEEEAKGLERFLESEKEKTKEPSPASSPATLQESQEQKSVDQENAIQAVDVCEKISNPYRRQICIASIEKDVARCQDEDCYFHIAIQKGDTVLCGKISDSHYENKATCKAIVEKNPDNWCKSETKSGYSVLPLCYIKTALEEDDPEICNHIPVHLNESFNADLNYCKALVEKKPQFCETLSGSKKELCYFFVAATTKNPAYCSQLEGNEKIGKKAACLKVAKRDVAGLDCKNSYQFQLCEAIAILDKEPSICENVLTGFNDRCYRDVAYSIAGVSKETSILFEKFLFPPSIKILE